MKDAGWKPVLQGGNRYTIGNGVRRGGGPPLGGATMQRNLWAMAAVLTAAVGVRADETAAVQAVEKLGGLVRRDDQAPGKPVIAVNLGFKRVTDQDLKVLADLKQLQSLSL